MDRPKIEHLMPEGTTFTDMHRKFRDNPELYRYICALDLYIDELIKDRIKQSLADYMKEFTPDDIIVGGEAEPPLTMIYGDDSEKEEKTAKEPYKSKFQKKLEEAMAKAEEAKNNNSNGKGKN